MTQQLAIDFEWYRCPQGYHFVNEDKYLDLQLQRQPPISDDVLELDQLKITIESNAKDPRQIEFDTEVKEELLLYYKMQLSGWKSDPKDPRQIEYIRQVKKDMLRQYNVDLANPKPVAIVPNSEERISYRPFDGHGSLIKSFAQIKTPEELLKFIRRYGQPESTPDTSVRSGLNAARQFRELLSCKSKGRKKMASVFKAQLPKNWDGQPTAERLVGTIHIIPDLSRGIRLRLTTDSLLNAMWWEFNQKIAGETIFRICRQCGSPFEAGPGGDTRADATFCCSEHSVLFHSLKR